LSDFVGPIVSKVKGYLETIDPIVTFLRSRVPVLSDLAGKDLTIIDMAAEAANASGNARAIAAARATQIFLDAYDFIHDLQIPDPGPDGSFTIQFGDMDFGDNFDLRGA